MRKFKAWCAFALAALLVFSIAACDNDPGGDNPGTTVAVTGVTVNPTTLTIAETENSLLKATVEPEDATNKAVTWSVIEAQPEGCVTVGSTSGNVTAKAMGTAKVQAKTNDGEFTAVCTVTVGELLAESISLTYNESSATRLLYVLDKSEPKTVNVVFEKPQTTDKTLTWTVANPAIAKVEEKTTGTGADIKKSAVVTALAEGKTTLTVKTKNNKTAVCEIEVMKLEGAIGISKPEDFDIIFEDFGGSYYLENDIDFENVSMNRYGKGKIGESASSESDIIGNFMPIGSNEISALKTGFAFSGTFDGRGYAIKNFQLTVCPSIKQATDNDGEPLFNSKGKPVGVISHYTNYCTGLFGGVAPTGVIRNLSLINGKTASNAAATGLLVGQNRGLVENCYIQGEVANTVTDWYGHGGAIVGRNNGIVRNVIAEIVSTSNGTYTFAGSFWDLEEKNGVVVSKAPDNNEANMYDLMDVQPVYMENCFVALDGLNRNDKATAFVGAGRSGSPSVNGGVSDKTFRNNEVFTYEEIDNDEVDFSALDSSIWDLTKDIPMLKNTTTQFTVVNGLTNNENWIYKFPGMASISVLAPVGKNYVFDIRFADFVVITDNPVVQYETEDGAKSVTGALVSGKDYRFTVPAADITGGSVKILDEITNISIPEKFEATFTAPTKDETWTYVRFNKDVYKNYRYEFTVKVPDISQGVAQPSVSYKVAGGAAKTLEHTSRLLVSGATEYTFIIPAVEVTGKVELGAITLKTVDKLKTLPAGFMPSGTNFPYDRSGPTAEQESVFGEGTLTGLDYVKIYVYTAKTESAQPILEFKILKDGDTISTMGGEWTFNAKASTSSSEYYKPRNRWATDNYFLAFLNKIESIEGLQGKTLYFKVQLIADDGETLDGDLSGFMNLAYEVTEAKVTAALAHGDTGLVPKA